MRWRLLRRRLTISAPRVAVRSALPWPLRWLVAAVVLGLCAAVALWAFEWGKTIAGLDAGARQELTQLRERVRQLERDNQAQLEKLQITDSLQASERAAVEQLAQQVHELEAKNGSLRDDLAFYERLIPASSSGKALSIRSLHAELLGGGTQLRWQVLAIQPMRNAPEFKGRLELVLSGSLAGQPWSTQPPAVDQPLQLQQYRRMQGIVDLPAQAQVKAVTVRLLEGSAVRASQTYAMD